MRCAVAPPPSNAAAGNQISPTSLSLLRNGQASSVLRRLFCWAVSISEYSLPSGSIKYYSIPRDLAAAISVTARGAPRVDAPKPFAKVHHLRVILHATFPARGSSLRTKAAPARSRCKEYRTPSWGIQKRPLADEAFLLKATSSMFFQFRSAVL